MIYLTEFDPADPEKKAVGPSTNSGFKSLDDVVAMMGSDYTHRAPRNVVYAGVCFSDFVISAGETSAPAMHYGAPRL
jgi:hypothetical protein